MVLICISLMISDVDHLFMHSSIFKDMMPHITSFTFLPLGEEILIKALNKMTSPGTVVIGPH